MNALNYICIGIAVVSAVAAAVAVFLYRQKAGKTIDKIGIMLDKAIDGSFEERVFDESALSSVESKLVRFLSISALSSKNLLAEKDKIKRLISDIAHQTKTPITNILLYSQLLGERELSEDCTELVQALSSQAEKLNFLISALVKLSYRLRQRKQHMQRKQLRRRLNQ